MFAILCFALGLWMTPENLSDLGIMDRSLASDNVLTRSTALWEVHTARSTLILLGIGSVLIALAYPHLTRWSSYQRFITRPDGLPPAYTNHLTQVRSRASCSVVARDPARAQLSHGGKENPI